MFERDIDISRLTGRTLVKADSDDSEYIALTMEDGAIVRFYHDQDCCEHVRLWDIVGGTVQDLEGQKIVGCSILQGDIPPEVNYQPGESHTWTEHHLRLEDERLIKFRWLGESNGYYSESIYISEEN